MPDDSWLDAIAQRLDQRFLQPDAVAHIFEGSGSECSREPNESHFRFTTPPAPPDPRAYPFSPNLMMSNFLASPAPPDPRAYPF